MTEIKIERVCDREIAIETEIEKDRDIKIHLPIGSGSLINALLRKKLSRQINTQLNNNNLGYLLCRLVIIGGWEKALQGDNTVLKCSFYYISVWQGQQIRRPGDVYH